MISINNGVMTYVIILFVCVTDFQLAHDSLIIVNPVRTYMRANFQRSICVNTTNV